VKGAFLTTSGFSFLVQLFPDWSWLLLLFELDDVWLMWMLPKGRRTPLLLPLEWLDERMGTVGILLEHV